jgi:hypothetical protein
VKDLASLQRAFQRHVYRPGRAMERAVLAASRADAVRRLGVYADAYSSRLVEALSNDYPALQGLLGETGFGRMMREFIAAHPSRHPNLRWYGGEVERFLARSPRWRRRPLLAELARFEWALGLAFDAADAPPATAEEVARLPAADWPGMRLRLHPSVRQLWLRSNAPQLWRAAREGGRKPVARLRRTATAWIVWRRGLAPFYRALAADESWALGAVARGLKFAAVCAGLRRFTGGAHSAQRGAQLLRNWLAEGLLSAGAIISPALSKGRRRTSRTRTPGARAGA